jgi:hypothetical protein
LKKTDNTQYLKFIYQNSNSTLNDIYEISKFLIGDHEKASINFELQQLRSKLLNEFPKKIEEKKKNHLNHSLQSFPLIPQYLQLIDDYLLVYFELTDLLHLLKPSINNE